jgi:two-component system cell cycle sensor histidine kinase/response regulator CckA
MNNLHRPIRLLLIIIFSVFLAEILVMGSLVPIFPTLTWWQKSLLDAALLSTLLFPLLQIFFLRPFHRVIQAKEAAEQTLTRAQAELEHSVHERTAELAATNERLEQEIDKRRRTEQELFETKEQWEEVFYTINDAITIHDRNYHIIRANKAAELLLGLSDRSLPEKCFALYHGAASPPKHCPSCITLHTGKTTITEIFEPHLNKYLEIKALPRVNEGGEIFGIIHIVRDIGERKKAEEEQRQLQAQLIRSQKMETIGRLAGGVAHDFNNILTIILSYTSLALRAVPAEGNVAENLNRIREAGERAATLARQLLAFSRKQVLDFRVVDLNEIINSMMQMIARVIGDNITLQLNLQDSISKVLADPGQIEQIIMNLAVNARDAMPEGGSLTIASADIEMDEEFISTHQGARPGSYAMFSFTDTGCGIPIGIQAKVFEPFFTTKSPEMGTGLGLSTVYGIVKQHNGYIYLSSEEGNGSTFKVYLPVGTENKNNSRPQRKDPLSRGTETILLAEDDNYVLRLLVEMLQSLGYQTISATDGEEALRVANEFQGRIDLLLTDVIMPGLNGRELADQLQEKRPEVKVIFMSGYTADAIAHFKIWNERETFLQKPLPPSRMLKVIRQMLDSP